MAAYDPLKSFSVIGKLVDSPYVLLVHPEVPAKNVQEFIAAAKANPNTLHDASPDALAQVPQGRLRALAATTSKRARRNCRTCPQCRRPACPAATPRSGWRCWRRRGRRRRSCSA